MQRDNSIDVNQLRTATEHHFKWDYRYHSTFLHWMKGLYRYWFAAAYRELNAFMSQFDDPVHILNEAEEFQLLTILIGYQLTDFSGFRSVVYQTKLYKSTILEMKDFLSICLSLIKGGIFTVENVAVCNQQLYGCRQNGYVPSLALEYLRKEGLLDQAHFDAVMYGVCQTSVATIITKLHRAGINTPANRQLLNERIGRNGYFLEHVITFLKPDYRQYSTELLTQANFERLMKYLHLISSNAYEWISMTADVHRHQATLERLFELLAACQNAQQAEEQIIQFTQVLRVVRGANIGLVLNPAQSTHTASVHESVSKTALNLFERYQDEIKDPLAVIKEIEVWLGSYYKLLDCALDYLSLPVCFAPTEITIAYRAIKRLRQVPSIHVDRASNINTHQLLALCWKAIHDDSTRLCTLADARERFVVALCDIQRGYNLDDHFKDNGGNDIVVCPPGTFNKLGEAMVGVYHSAELIVITKAGLGLKLPVVVREEVKREVLQSSNPAYLIKRIQSEGIDSIWKAIFPAIRERLFEEYGSLFNNNIGDSEFVAVINAGKATSLDFLVEMEQSSALKVSTSRLTKFGASAVQNAETVNVSSSSLAFLK